MDWQHTKKTPLANHHLWGSTINRSTKAVDLDLGQTAKNWKRPSRTGILPSINSPCASTETWTLEADQTLDWHLSEGHRI